MANEFEVEEILNKRLKNGNVEYLLKWKGFTSRYNSWVIESDANCQELIEGFQIGEFEDILGTCVIVLATYISQLHNNK